MSDKEVSEKLLEISEKLAIEEVERKNMLKEIDELKHDVKHMSSLAEDVHIMASNMEIMQATLNKTSNKVDKLANKEFTQYEENKKTIRNSILSAIFGAVGTGLVGFGIWFAANFIGK